jgi:hypothetical protein
VRVAVSGIHYARSDVFAAADTRNRSILDP